jgi:hypothetical protein
MIFFCKNWENFDMQVTPTLTCGINANYFKFDWKYDLQLIFEENSYSQLEVVC